MPVLFWGIKFQAHVFFLVCNMKLRLTPPSPIMYTASTPPPPAWVQICSTWQDQTLSLRSLQSANTHICFPNGCIAKLITASDGSVSLLRLEGTRPVQRRCITPACLSSNCSTWPEWNKHNIIKLTLLLNKQCLISFYLASSQQWNPDFSNPLFKKYIFLCSEYFFGNFPLDQCMFLGNCPPLPKPNILPKARTKC